MYVIIYYIWESKQYFFPCLSESVGFSGDFYQILGSLIESKYLGTSSPGIEVFHRWVKWREGMLKNMQPWKRATDWFTADFKIGPSIVTRLSEPILYGGRNDFCLGMNLDEFGQVLGPRRPGVRDKGHILPHSDSTPQPLLRLITQFVLVKCNLASQLKI